MKIFLDVKIINYYEWRENSLEGCRICFLSKVSRIFLIKDIQGILKWDNLELGFCFIGEIKYIRRLFIEIGEREIKRRN